MSNPLISIPELKAKGPEAQLDLLFHNKNTLLEGMVFESVLDQKFFRKTPANLVAIPCHAMVATVGGHKRKLVFVWFPEATPHRPRMVSMLSSQYDVHEVAFDPAQQDFIVAPVPMGNPSELLSAFLARTTGTEPYVVPRRIPPEDLMRQRAVAYGFIQFPGPEVVFKNTILPRILKDFRIEPYCRGCWDLDRFLAFGDDIWSLEIKHKYPRSDGSFGLNKGQVNEIVSLTACGFNFLHVVFVKPHWNSNHSAMELLVDQSLGEHLGIIGCKIDHAFALRLHESPDEEAPAKTSLTATRTQLFKRLELDNFFALGRYDQSAEKEIWPRILQLMQGIEPSGGPVTLERLRRIRLEGWAPRR